MTRYVLLLLFFGLLMPWRLSADENKRVLLISSYNSRFPTYFQQIDAIKSVLDSLHVDFDAEFMDTKRFVDEATRELFYRSLQNKIRLSPSYDLVLLADDDAFNFGLRHQQELFNNIPMVFFGVNNTERALEQNQNPAVTGLIEAVSMKETLALMIRLFPASGRLYCIADSTPSGLSDLRLFRQYALQFPGTEFREINMSALTFAAYTEQLAAVPADAPVLLLSAYHDRTKQTIDFHETLGLLNRHLRAPVFHLWEHGLGAGILGGKMISHRQQAKTAVMMAHQILAGKPVSAIEVVRESPNIYQFDHVQLLKHHVNLKQLPPDAVVLNRPISFWEKNRRLLLLIMAVMLLLLGVVVVLSVNILKRKKSEQALKKQHAAILKLNAELVESKLKAEEGEEKFKKLFYDHSAIKLLLDATTGHIFDANPAAIAFYGYDFEQLTSMNIREINILPSDEVKQLMEQVNTNLHGHFELKHQKADGSIADVDVFATKISISGRHYLFSIIHDVTERKKQDHKIQLLSHSVEQSPVGIVIADCDGMISYVNQAYKRITGLFADNDPDGEPKNLQAMMMSSDECHAGWDDIRSGKAWMGEVQRTTTAGEPYWVHVVISPIYIHEILTNILVVCEDITEKKKNVEELIQAKEKAEESNKLKTEFLHNMSHEIRTPMNSIIGFADMLMVAGIDEKQRQHFADIIIRSSQQLLNIIDDILEISRLETRQVSIERETFRLNELFDVLYEMFLPSMQAQGLNFQLDATLSDGQDYIISDKAKINRTLINLIENALKFTRKGHIKTGYRVEGDKLVMYVEDSGIGISAENIGRIFDRFAQEEVELSQKYGGIGLGLSISKENASLLGGELYVESEKQVGSTFFLSIPYVAADKTPDEAGTTLARPDINTPFTLLLAEDEALNSEYVETLLVGVFGSKIRLLHARDGQSAVAQCEQHPEIRLVLMDLKMPRLNGLEATRQIKARQPDLPVIALTAYSTEEDRQLAMQSGCDAFISKPIDKQVLLETLQRFLK